MTIQSAIDERMNVAKEIPISEAALWNRGNVLIGSLRDSGTATHRRGGDRCRSTSTDGFA